MARINTFNLIGRFRSHSEAMGAIKSPGDAAIVIREVPRAFLLCCPCGCGDTLVMNLDQRAGPAWRLYVRKDMVTVYPSYWRVTHCGSHFIIWDSRIFWCDWRSEEDFWPDATPSIEHKIKIALSYEFQTYDSIADGLGEIPWDVLQACNSLVRHGIAECNFPNRKGEFRLKSHTSNSPSQRNV